MILPNYISPYNGVINNYNVHEGWFTGEKNIIQSTIPIPTLEEYLEITIINGQKYKRNNKKDKQTIHRKLVLF